ncbi:hypothetical protein GCM10010353_20260 [Streptomyces chryseus]|uniref:Uncharacterized protein n=1 Tax=Streptomyces chryseus TaxID=68186 RepID=A0ABQ3DNP1_9ACTN|nr:hypothetical protein GCM10010353_20260 [Streptomyces chryseus]GHB07981.1 hypothetical protein GCM10010346_34150 [Streptomyces chryseus]
MWHGVCGTAYRTLSYAVYPARAVPDPGTRVCKPDGRGHAGLVAPANGIWSSGASRTGAPGRGAWIIWPSPT